MAENYDAERDALALVRAEVSGDRAGVDVILDNCCLRDVAETLAGMFIGLMRQYTVAAGVPEPDADRVMDEQLAAALGRESH